MKKKKIKRTGIVITAERVQPFLLPADRLVSEMIRICEIYDTWKVERNPATGILNDGNVVRTNLHTIPYTEVTHRVFASLSGTPFELRKNGMFKDRRQEVLWRESIERGEYLASLH